MITDEADMAMEMALTAEKTLEGGDPIQALCLLAAIPAFLPQNQKINMGDMLCDAVRGHLTYDSAIRSTIRIITSVREGETLPANTVPKGIR